MLPFANANAFCPPLSDSIQNIQLAANTPTPVIWPNAAAIVNMNGSAAFYASDLAQTTTPVSNIIDGTGAALNPASRSRPLGQTQFYLISPTAQNISCEFWGS